MSQEKMPPCVGEEKCQRDQDRILIVDDEPLVRDMLAMVLENSGYKILKASSAEEALEFWEVHGASIDLLLTDLVMPGRISGTQLAEELHGQNPDLKIIFTSGYSVETARRDFQLGKHLHFLQKPFETPQLLELIERCLGQRDGEGAATKRMGPEEAFCASEHFRRAPRRGPPSD